MATRDQKGQLLVCMWQGLISYSNYTLLSFLQNQFRTFLLHPLVLHALRPKPFQQQTKFHVILHQIELSKLHYQETQFIETAYE